MDSKEPTTNPPVRSPWDRRDTVALLAVLVLAGVLRVWHLNSQLWLDEMSALNSIRRPLGTILTQWPGASSHILFEALAHIGNRIAGGASWGIRLPAALFGVAGVAAMYVLGRVLVNRAGAVFLSALLAVSYHHVFFSQNARGYTMLMCFFLLATYLFLRMDGREHLSLGLAGCYVAVAALGTYANLFGGFVLAGHAAVAGVLYFTRRGVAARRFPYRGYATAAAVASGVIGLLYLPFLPSILAYTRANVADPGEGPRLSLGLLVELLEGMRAALGGWSGLLAFGLAGLAGAWFWGRRFPLALALLAVPLVLQAGALVVLGAGIHPRYFANALPGAVLVAGTSMVELVRWARHRLGAAGRVGEPLVLGLVVLASAAPLRQYYRYPKQDYLGAADAVAARAQSGDAQVGVHLAGHVLQDFYGLPFLQVETASDLASLEAQYQRLWLVTTLERLLAVHDSALARHIHDRYQTVEVFPGTVGDGAVRLYVGPQ